jgi:hypothetical protein
LKGEERRVWRGQERSEVGGRGEEGAPALYIRNGGGVTL